MLLRFILNFSMPQFSKINLHNNTLVDRLNKNVHLIKTDMCILYKIHR